MNDLEHLKRKAKCVGLTLGNHNGHYYLQGFEETVPFLFDADLEHIKLFLDGYWEASREKLEEAAFLYLSGKSKE